MIWEPTEPPEKNKRVIAPALCVEKDDPAEATKRVLYVNYDPTTLIRDEQLLLGAGYEGHTVFGVDGVMACRSAAEYAYVLIDETCPREDQSKLICWLAANSPKLDILSPSWLYKRAAPADATGPSPRSVVTLRMDKGSRSRTG